MDRVLGCRRLSGVEGVRGECITPVRCGGGTMECLSEGGLEWIWLEMPDEKYVFRLAKECASWA